MKKKLFFILLIICMLFYPLYSSYYSINIVQYEMNSDQIQKDIHIIMISDLHDMHCKVKNQIIQKIKSRSPDLILCVGDMIDDTSKSDDAVIQFYQSLSSIAPVYVSLGNHEITYEEDHPSIDYTKANVKLLENSSEIIELNGNKIELGGMYDYAFDTYFGTIEKEKMHNSEVYQFLSQYTLSPYFKLMMAHRPDSFIFGDARDWNLDLVVSGHYHGGQMILPLIGGIYAPELGWFPSIDAGQYDLGNFPMIITRGLSSSKEKIPRYNNPCEITEIILK